MLDPVAKKSVLRLFTYGLYGVTCSHDRDANVFTANWLSQVSFDPPMLALSVENDSASLPLILASSRFAVHVFSATQRDLAGMLGKPRARVGDKLSMVPHRRDSDGLPVLLDTLGYVSCRVTGTLPAGDSTVVVGEVITAELLYEGEPLTMRDAGFRHSG